MASEFGIFGGARLFLNVRRKQLPTETPAFDHHHHQW